MYSVRAGLEEDEDREPTHPHRRDRQGNNIHSFLLKHLLIKAYIYIYYVTMFYELSTQMFNWENNIQ